MTTSTVITDYLGRGTHAARPASPPIPTGGTAIYYETDTTDTFGWDGSAWYKVNAGSTVNPTIVQHATTISASNTSVTLSSAPINGNLLVALMVANGVSGPASGWTALTNTVAGNFGVYYKIAGASESTTQTPQSSGIAGVISIYEISNAKIGLVSYFPNITNTSVPVNNYAGSTHDIVLGAILQTTGSTAISSVTNGTVDDDVPISGRSGACFHSTTVTANAINTYTINYGSSTGIYVVTLTVYGG